MKKLFAILLALAMIFAMSATVFAADEDDTLETTISITDGHTYNAYKLLNVSTNVKAGDTCENDNHTDDCYTYSYSVNGNYLDILKEKTGKTTEADIIAYLAGLKDDADKMRTLADNLYAAVKDRDADEKGLTNGSTIEHGYWLFADVTDVNEAYKAKSLAIVNTAGLKVLPITAKTGLPTVTKEVLEVNDTENTTAWGAEADHDIGDAVSFKLTATLHDKIANYDSYKLVFHDTLSAGLTLGENPTFTVTVDGQTITNPFAYAADQNGAFTLTCENVKDIPGITEDSVIVVTYTATLTSGTVNTNTVQMEFSNDPYSDSTGMTEVVTVTVKTYQLTVNKVDGANNLPLPGAEFTLEKKVGDNYVLLATPTVNDDTEFVWTGLDAGTYRLTETKAPAGYNKAAEPITVTIVDGDVTETVKNNTGTVLPETGAQGTFMLITGGTLLVVLAAVFMITRKKMSIYED